MEKSGRVVLDSRFSMETSRSPEAVTRTSEGEHRGKQRYAALRSSGCLIKDSTGMPSPLCSCQIIFSVNGRVRLRIS